MSLSLKLELKSSNKVLVTNSETQEQKEVTLSFLQEITGDSLSMLVQYKYYELILSAEKHWNSLRRFNSEIEKIKEIYLETKVRKISIYDQKFAIADYEREMYHKALASVDSSNLKNNNDTDKTADFTAVTGSLLNAFISNSIYDTNIATNSTINSTIRYHYWNCKSALTALLLADELCKEVGLNIFKVCKRNNTFKVDIVIEKSNYYCPKSIKEQKLLTLEHNYPWA